MGESHTPRTFPFSETKSVPILSLTRRRTGQKPCLDLRFVSTIFRALGVPIKFLGKEEVAGSNPVTEGLYLRVAQSGRAPNNTPRPFSFSVQKLFLFFGYTFWFKSQKAGVQLPIITVRTIF